MSFSRSQYISSGVKRGISLEILTRDAEYIENLSTVGLFPLLSLNQLSYVTNKDYFYLRRIVQRRNISSVYNTFEIPKQNGKLRSICSPESDLYDVQKWILENILENRPRSLSSFAYHKHISIKDAASAHVGSTWAFKIDFQDFFTNIKEKQVFKLFRSLGYAPLISFELSRLCTFDIALANSNNLNTFPYKKSIDSHLPQGAPTSGAISNLIAWKLDEILIDFSKRNNLTYTRYADDLIFSSREKFNRNQISTLIHSVYQISIFHNFKINTKKTIIIPPGKNLEVLGINVTQLGLKVRKTLLNDLEFHIKMSKAYSLETHSYYKGFKSPFGFINYINGNLGYVKMIDETKYIKLIDDWEDSLKEFYSSMVMSPIPASWL